MEVVTMEYCEEVLKKQYPILKDFIYHYISYKELLSVIEQLKGDEFWIRTTDAHIKTAIMSWCMVFGSDNNETHWKKLLISDYEIKCKDFRTCILTECNLDSKGWESYWRELIDFRNDFIAHRKLEFDQPTPFLDISFRVAVLFDLWVRKNIEPDYLNFPTLEEQSEKYKTSINKTISTLI